MNNLSNHSILQCNGFGAVEMLNIFSDFDVFVDPYFWLMLLIKKNKFCRRGKIPKLLVQNVEPFDNINKQF